MSKDVQGSARQCKAVQRVGGSNPSGRAQREMRSHPTFCFFDRSAGLANRWLSFSLSLRFKEFHDLDVL
ncbi:MAG: hypothetical protein DMG41_12095 [Acidobacteria bacterium]|nr:MAG: hypothetical protein AUH13_18765 [Acidobacteria bacterium 13_2_20CM_58_27]PYT88102.1 MAG: hypothetical protein DMG41_12095 [Acidobacteriota bacterium]